MEVTHELRFIEKETQGRESVNYTGDPSGTGLGFYWGCADRDAIKSTQIKSPSGTIMIADSKGDGTQDYLIRPDMEAYQAGNRHSVGVNVLWCDGHVSWHSEDVINATASWWNKNE